jgi:hypothetical protein
LTKCGYFWWREKSDMMTVESHQLRLSGEIGISVLPLGFINYVPYEFQNLMAELQILGQNCRGARSG